MAIANYEDRFVIPTAHREWTEDACELRGSCGFSFGNGCSAWRDAEPVRRTQKARDQDADGGRVMKIFRILSALLTYPTPEFVAALDEIGAALDGEASARR